MRHEKRMIKKIPDINNNVENNTLSISAQGYKNISHRSNTPSKTIYNATSDNEQ